MDTICRDVISLIKSAVTGKSHPLPEDFQWNPAIKLMFRQGLGAMCYSAARNYGMEPDGELLTFLFDQYCILAVQSMQQLEQLDALYKAFEENGIAYMPVKGAVTKSLYPDHAMRTMSDGDILIRQEEYDRIRPVMRQLNFREAGESDHEYIWKNDALTVELHKRLIPSYNKDYYSYFGEGWDLAKVNVGGCRWAMTPEDAFLYDTIHFAKHYRDADVNTHFLLDLWIRLRSFPDLDQAYIRRQMARLRMEKFYDSMLGVIQAWFEDGPWDEKTQHITEVLFAGDPRQAQRNAAIAQSARAAQAAGSVRRARSTIFLRKIFPAKENICYSYPQWKQVPLPFAWVLRWFGLLLHRRDTVLREAAKHNQVTTQDIESYRKDLEYVGLEFSDQVVLPE